MQAGNRTYHSAGDLPEIVPVFPLTGALLLPGGRMPLNIFEPRYLEMIEAAMAGDRLIGMIQPALDDSRRADGEPHLTTVGCLGRIISFAESGDGRYLITLNGVCRFRLGEEVSRPSRPYRMAHVTPFAGDLKDDDRSEVDREALISAFQAFVEANEMEVDWRSVEQASTQTLVNVLSMMSPYGPAEKQALLEAPDLKSRADTLVAITELLLAKVPEGSGSSKLQ
ncbi:LON peptidase substrate-binding domain-containing protein [Notoacmeibacter ruber]|uniref:ATP-dependent protease n=1 Tax=Notoacmeibacter ruber TaxID=2670375 RepID=A0A3L7JM44_9HYPH|nr:LON peptidase substrate-binding domain-containing protein [Notoacmeibacter ruber]RLQ89622.1 ATP-dependent protease [Notoacmeibacter ruber]